jgi:hypothetical protein
MTELPLIDLIRFLHLAVLAAGMGAGLYVESRILGRMSRPVSERCVRDAEHAHRFVTLTLAALWVSGAVLIHFRTGFDLSRFTPKLWTKLIVVSVLTLDALAIGIVVVPLYRRTLGHRLAYVKRAHLALFFTTGAVSLVSWLSALALGSSVVLKTAEWSLLAPMLLAIYGGAILAAALATFVVHSQLHIRPAAMQPNA